MKTLPGKFTRALSSAGITVMIFTALQSCGDSKQTKENIAGAARIGHERALELAPERNIDIMQIESILIEVREREQHLRNLGENKVADAYIDAFINTLDSINPSLAEQLR